MHLLEIISKDGAEDQSHGFVVQLTDAHMVEVASKPWCYETAATTWRTHCRYELAIYHLAEHVGTVIPAQRLMCRTCGIRMYW